MVYTMEYTMEYMMENKMEYIHDGKDYGSVSKVLTTLLVKNSYTLELTHGQACAVRSTNGGGYR